LSLRRTSDAEATETYACSFHYGVAPATSHASTSTTCRSFHHHHHHHHHHYPLSFSPSCQLFPFQNPSLCYRYGSCRARVWIRVRIEFSSTVWFVEKESESDEKEEERPVMNQNVIEPLSE
jgi:hypothetical protein